MGTDYPAAHSMDTHWFAVDRDGRVGVFFTSENGFYPVSAAEVDSFDLVELWRALFVAPPPGVLVEDGDESIEDWDEFLDALVEQGFYYYNFVETGGDPDQVLTPYVLWGEPASPLHVGQLPPAWRERCGSCVLAGAGFGEDEQLQPLEFIADAPVSYCKDACAYLSGDETVIRPIPGREEKFGEFCQGNASELRSRRKDVRIEGY